MEISLCYLFLGASNLQYDINTQQEITHFPDVPKAGERPRGSGGAGEAPAEPGPAAGFSTAEPDKSGHRHTRPASDRSEKRERRPEQQISNLH